MSQEDARNVPADMKPSAEATKRQPRKARAAASPIDRPAVYVHGKTLCNFCRCPVKVTGTKTSPLDGGRVLITRQVRCEGAHRHTYTIDTIEKGMPAATEEEDAEK